MSELTDAILIEADNPVLVAEAEIDYILIPGPPGSPGDDGPAGPPGAGILSGSGVPGSGLGNNGDFYYDSANQRIYGPKTSGAWGSGVLLKGDQGDPGPQGDPGDDGDDGAPGVNGNLILTGTVNPTSQGANGDFYLNTSTYFLFGPKSGGVWPAGHSLTGPAGEDGEFSGNTILYGTAAPTTEGTNGDFYLKTTDPKTIYGPKAAGVWPSGTSLVGPAGAPGADGADGEDGAPGAPGADGADGADGAPGADGRTLLNGTVNPTGGVGANGDFYINTTSNFIFGPKASGTWPSGVSITGPAGPTGSAGSDGEDGAPGADGADGNTILSGSGVPDGLLGNNGDLYYRTSNTTIYGPKSGGSWGSPVSLIGATGTAGLTVRSGSGVPSNGLGVDGDFYIRTSNYDIYGPKTGGSWGSPTSLVGTAGSNGTNGNTILSGTAAPTTEGVNGDYYFRTTTNFFYGPKAGGVWPAGFSIVGPAGSGGSGGNAGFYYLCAADAHADEKAKASLVCDGTADQTDFATALTACMTYGIKLKLSAGTFQFSAPFTIMGPQDIDNEAYEFYMDGAGPGRTIIALANNQAAAIQISGCARVHLSNFRMYITGSSHGISSYLTNASASGNRSFWLSSFKNIQVVGDWGDTNHTGWGFHLGSPFRSTFENIEMGGIGNGIRMYSENSAQNPGDCTFTRCFIDTVGNNKIAYSIESTTVNGVMNQMTFNMCEAIATGTGCTGIYIGGTGGTPGRSNHNKFWGTNLEQFDKLVEIAYGEGNVVDCNYIETRAAANNVAFTFGANAFNNRVGAEFIYMASALTQYLYTDGNTAFPYQPNIIEKVKVYADSTSVVTKSENTAGTTISRQIVCEGSGNYSAILRPAGYVKPPTVITYAATISPDARAGSDFECTMTGALTINGPANPTHGQKVFFYLTASGANRTATLATGAGNFKFGSDITALSATVSGTTDMIGAIYNSTANRWFVNAYVKGF